MKRFKVQQFGVVFMTLILSVFLITGCGSDGQTGHWLPSGLMSLKVTPATSSIAIGAPQQFVAIATYHDGSSRDVTASAHWTSSAAGVATVNSASGVAIGVAGGTSVITAGYDGQSASATLTVTSAILTSLAVTPATASIPISGPKPFMMTATYSDGSTRDVTTFSSWTSGTIGVATINNTSGIATGVAVGTSTITATYLGLPATAALTVTGATLSSIAVTPSAATVQIGLTKPFVATGTYSDGTTLDISHTVLWTSSATGVATVLSSTGVATGVSAGTTTITATLGGKSGSATLTVPTVTLSSIAVTPAAATVQIGLTKQFVATGTYSDGTTRDISNAVVWTSGSTAVATVVSPSGIATGESAGTATITATLSGKSGSAILTVPAATLSSIAVTPATATVQIGLTRSFIATGTYSDGTTLDITNMVLWTSSSTAVATVVSPTGVATGVSAGTATITATLGGKSGSATLTVPAATLSSISVTPLTAIVQIGLTKKFVATGTYSDGTTLDITNMVLWSSGNTAVATVVSPTGVATGVSAGTATITATLSGKSGSATLTVPAATLSSIAVMPSPTTVQAGLTRSFIATGTYSDGTTADITTTVTWTSSNTGVATVLSTTGVATGVSVGTATITATLGGKSGSAILTVPVATLVSIEVMPSPATVPIGVSFPLIAIGTYSDGSTAVITDLVQWSTGCCNPTVITLGANTGIATGVAAGTVTVMATLGGKYGTGTVIVPAATLSSIAVTPATATVQVNGKKAFVATGTYSDGTTAVITTTVTWTSGATGVATVLSTTGVATGVSAGTATITATLGSKSASATLTVPASVLGPPPVDLGTAGNFVILTKTGITNVPTSAITGNIGTSPVTGAAIAGLGCGEVNGIIYTVDAAGPACRVIDPISLTTAVSDMLIAYNDAAGRTTPDATELGAGNLTGLIIPPGLYKWSTGVSINSSGAVTLTGGVNDVWIFQIAGDIILNTNSTVTLAGGAQAKNIFWQTGGATGATINAGSTFNGIILSAKQVILKTGATLNGRAFADSQTTLEMNMVTQP